MKIKSDPTHFHVEEISNRMLSPTKKQFSVYKLTKSGVDTLFALKTLAQENEISLHQIGYAGLKDKYAQTVQYISVASSQQIHTTQQNVSLDFIGYTDKQITVGDLDANTFRILLTQVSKQQMHYVAQNLVATTMYFPNYFDSQRFGSVREGYFALCDILSGNVERVVAYYLTQIIPSDNKSVKIDKKYIAQSLKDSEGFFRIDLASIRSKKLKNVLYCLQKSRNFWQAYTQIPKTERMFFELAFQSKLFNEQLHYRIVKNEKNIIRIPYVAGDLAFSSDATYEKLLQKQLDFFTLDTTDKSLLAVLEQTFGIKPPFNSQSLKVTNMATGKRSAIAMASEIAINVVSKNSLQVRATLPKGSYVTVLLKQIFGKVDVE